LSDRSRLSPVSADEFGVVRATTFTVAPGCFAGSITSVEGNGKASSSRRKNPMNDGSTIWFFSSMPGRFCACTAQGARTATTAPVCVCMGMRIPRAQSRTASFFMSTP
jgi:hypothetical protein